jgi:hypothetical protein
VGNALQLTKALSRADGGELQVCTCGNVGNVPNFEFMPGPFIVIGVGKARSALI